MPFWFWDKKEEYTEILDDNSVMSIDDTYDPEKDIKLRYYEDLSRIAPYREIFARFMKKM